MCLSLQDPPIKVTGMSENRVADVIRNYITFNERGSLVAMTLLHAVDSVLPNDLPCSCNLPGVHRRGKDLPVAWMESTAARKLSSLYHAHVITYSSL